MGWKWSLSTAVKLSWIELVNFPNLAQSGLKMHLAFFIRWPISYAWQTDLICMSPYDTCMHMYMYSTLYNYYFRNFYDYVRNLWNNRKFLDPYTQGVRKTSIARDLLVCIPFSLTCVRPVHSFCDIVCKIPFFTNTQESRSSVPLYSDKKDFWWSESHWPFPMYTSLNEALSHTHTYMHTHAQMHACMDTCAHTHTHTHTHTYTHTHAHTHTQSTTQLHRLISTVLYICLPMQPIRDVFPWGI